MEVFNRPPDDSGFTPSGYAWASWYNKDDGQDAVHTTVQWKPAKTFLHEPEYKIVKWTIRDGVHYKEKADD